MGLCTLFWLLFLADSAVHVAACAASKQQLRRFSKILLMPLLLAAYVFSAPGFLWPVAAGLFFGWIGDIFMIYKHNRRRLAAGMAAFGIGHLFYIGAIFQHFSFAPPPWTLFAVPMLFFCIAAGSYACLRRDIHPQIRRITFFYALVLSAVGAIAVLALISGAPGSLLLTVGAVCFLLSDSVLSLETFRMDDSPKIDFIVMLTYIAAQTLIVLSFLV